MRRLIVPLLACVIAACRGESNASSTPAAAVDTVDGVERWTYPATPAPALPWRFDTLAVIGGAMAESEDYQFEGVMAQGLAGNAQGDLFLADAQGKRILRYDRSGRFVRGYGREGGGPGELRFPMSVQLGPGDSVWVADMMNRRITIYDAASDAVRTLTPTDAQSLPPSRIALAAGHFYAPGTTMRTAGPGGAGERPPTPLVRFALDGTPLDTVWRSAPRRSNAVEARFANQLVRLTIKEIFAPVFHWAALSDGTVIVADSANYVLHFVAPDGTVKRTLRRDPPARATTEADREAAREQTRRQAGPRIAGAPVDKDEFLRRRLESMTFADVIPRIVDLTVDPKDRIWVGVSVDEPGEVERIDVYDASGRLLGEIRDPAFFPDLLYGPGFAAELTEDENEVQQVVVMRLVE